MSPARGYVKKHEPEAEELDLPNIGEWFELSVDHTDDSVGVLAQFGVESLELHRWIFKGPAYKGHVTRRCQLIGLGQVINRGEAAVRLSRINSRLRLAEGQASIPFRQTFRRHKQRPVAFGGNSWLNRRGEMVIPVLLTPFGPSWSRAMRDSTKPFSGAFLWLAVEID